MSRTVENLNFLENYGSLYENLGKTQTQENYFTTGNISNLITFDITSALVNRYTFRQSHHVEKLLKISFNKQEEIS